MNMKFFFTTDIYKGVHIDMMDERNHHLENIEFFEKTLIGSINQWKQESKRVLWFILSLDQCYLLKFLNENNFKFHHAKDRICVLYSWIEENDGDMVPEFSRCRIGVGGLAVDFERKELLLIQEKYSSSKKGRWKLPGGAHDRNESIERTAVREVLEETGVKTEFVDILGFRYCWDLHWSKTVSQDDIYFACLLKTISREINLDEKEISKCEWISFEQFFKMQLTGTVQVIKKSFQEYLSLIEKEGGEIIEKENNYSTIEELIENKKKMKMKDVSWKSKERTVQSKWYQIV